MKTPVAPTWTFISASVPGSSHIAHELPCQDAHEVIVLSSGEIAIAVADGAGSGKHSERGSELAVRSSIAAVIEQLNTRRATSEADAIVVLRNAALSAREALERSSNGDDLRDIATTLIVAIISPDLFAAVQIGDGAIICREASEELKVLTTPRTSEYLNETSFLTSDGFLDELHYTVMPSDPITGVAILTDGVETLALNYSTNTAHEPFFKTMFDFASNPASSNRELEEFLKSDRVCDRTDDDKTLVLAVRRGN